MRRTFIVLVTLVALTAGVARLPAQLTPFFWVTRGLLGGAQCSVCVFDPGGGQITGFQVPSITAPVAAKHMLGVVWVLNATSNTLVPHTLAGPIVTLPINAGSGLAVAPNGDLWIQSGGLFTPFVLERRTPFGALIFSVTPSALAPVDIRVDPAGSVWIADAIAGQVEKIDPLGASQGLFNLPVSTRPSTLEVGPLGEVWVLALDSMTTAGDLVKLDTNGNIQFTTSYQDLRDFDLDVCGRPHVLHGAGNGTVCVDVLDPANGQVQRSFVVPTGIPDLTEIKLASSGGFWVTSSSGGVLVPVSRDGVFGVPSNAPGLGGPSGAGDPTGLHLVSVIDPLGDGDGDGIPNRDEISSGSDPLDPTSVPAQLFLSGSTSPGGSFSLTGAIPAEAGRPYVFAIAGNAGSLPVGTLGCLQLPVTVDPILIWWLSSSNVLSNDWFGQVGPTGVASMNVTLPPGPSLSGTSVVGLLVTGDPATAQIATISQALSIPLQ